MKKIIKMIFLIIVGNFFGYLSFASFFDAPLDLIVEGSRVVVIGEIEKIHEAQANPEQEWGLMDIAHIRVTEVLKDEMAGQDITIGQTILLSMPSINNKYEISTDLRYHNRQNGVWILDFDGKYFRATYPKDFQGLNQAKNIKSMITKQRKERDSAYNQIIEELLNHFAEVTAIPLYSEIQFTADLNKKIDDSVDVDSLHVSYVKSQESHLGWVFIDKNGNVVFATRLSASFEGFSNGLAALGSKVENGAIKNYGFIDRTGNFAIKPIYDQCLSFQEGLAQVTLDNKAGFINTIGEVVIPLKYDMATSFTGGVAQVWKDEKSYLIDKKGKILFESNRGDVGTYSNGFLFVNVVPEKTFHSGETPKVPGGRFIGYVDRIGQFAVEASESSLGFYVEDRDNFYEGYAAIKAYGGVLGKWGYISSEGNLTVKPHFYFAGEFSEGLAPVAVNTRQSGFINTSGEMVIKPSFIWAKSFSDGLAPVNVRTWDFRPKLMKDRKDGDLTDLKTKTSIIRREQWGYINKRGNMVIKPWFDSAERFHDGLATVNEGNTIGFINESGSYVWRSLR